MQKTEERADLLTSNLNLLGMIFDSGIIKTTIFSSILKEWVSFSINIVNEPTSKDMDIVFGICPIHHGTQLWDHLSVAELIYDGDNDTMTPSAQCKTFNQFAKQYDITCHNWHRVPFY
eukprot:1853681-Ditylum_brightwellii.AAC.1